MEKKIEGVKKVTFSLKGNEALAFGDFEIWLLKNGDFEFLVRTAEKIEEAIFLSKNYFVFSTQNKIFIGETDKEGGENLYQIAEFGAQKIILFKPNQILIQNERGTFLSTPLY
ncbi:hypothetical protein H5T58_02070 [Candidatus Parcubacteria bacterium]|nr:hypothetical protein [Candidatus Parcubacteria bacterium]